MAKMTNIGDHPIKVKISTMPGQPPMVTPLAPGESSQFPDGYCRPVQSAGKAQLPCILSRGNTHLGVPILAPEGMEKEYREQYERTKAGQTNSHDPASTIRRLEAELAQARAQAPAAAPAPKAAKVAPLPPAPDEAEELLDATTPTPKPKAKRRKAKG